MNADGVQKGVWGSPGTRVTGSCEPLGWVLGTELKSFARATVLLTSELSLRSTEDFMSWYRKMIDQLP